MMPLVVALLLCAAPPADEARLKASPYDRSAYDRRANVSAERDGSAKALAERSGTLDVTFVYMPPTSVEPTYHTAIWLEDESGALVKTLFVTNDLSSREYKIGEACPDWVKQAHWEKAPASDVDAVTGPTPNVGSGGRAFDLATLGIAPGRYVFKLQVHITGNFNILYKGTLVVGDAASEVTLETLYSPGRPPGGTEFVRDVRARYVPAR